MRAVRRDGDVSGDGAPTRRFADHALQQIGTWVW
jgi:hypothetical protein